MNRGKMIGYGILLVALIIIVIGAIVDVKPIWVIGLILLPVSLVIRVLIEEYDDRTQQEAEKERKKCYQEGRLAEREAWESRNHKILQTNNKISNNNIEYIEKNNKLTDEDASEEETDIEDSIESNPIIIKEIERVYKDLNEIGGARKVGDISSDSAGRLLLEVCKSLSYSPVNGFTPISFVAKEDFDGNRAINFIRMGDVVSSTEFIYLFLVLTQHNNIRIFTIEPSFSGVMLCEYTSHTHSIIDFLESPIEIPDKIKKVLSEEC